MDSLFISNLLREVAHGECGLVVLAKRHIHRYVDEQNSQTVPPSATEAGWEI